MDFATGLSLGFMDVKERTWSHEHAEVWSVQEKIWTKMTVLIIQRHTANLPEHRVCMGLLSTVHHSPWNQAWDLANMIVMSTGHLQKYRPVLQISVLLEFRADLQNGLPFGETLSLSIYHFVLHQMTLKLGFPFCTPETLFFGHLQMMGPLEEDGSICSIAFLATTWLRNPKYIHGLFNEKMMHVSTGGFPLPRLDAQRVPSRAIHLVRKFPCRPCMTTGG